MITKEEKDKIILEFQMHKNDKGSTSIQIAILSKRINNLQTHLNINKKDFSANVGLKKMVSTRRSFLLYLKKNSEKEYKNLIKNLGLRK